MEKPFQLKLIIRRVSATASLQWLKAAWQLFKQTPAVFVAMFLLTAAIGLLLAQHQLSAIVGVFLSPFLTAGFYKAVVGAQQQQKIGIDWLFQPLAEPACRRVLIMIAALNYLLTTPLMSFHQHLYQTMSVAIEARAGIDAIVLLQLVLMVALFALVFMLFAYAVAIAYFLKEQRIVLVLQASFIACWRNVGALLIFGLLSIALVLLTLPTFFLGLIVVAPLLNIAFFLSFNDLFALQVNTTDDGVLEV
ncbi:hypothetical protein WG68_01230 [Arsukibacterium ikkense]|uniref:DUF624 domain-containing protein n=1 Tax=Arsukibacterium ikkense TaxID=336831 RepID=A0A0M2VE96_9GAMM|nr:hypothetical protein [Arsukibacterium ikkense]KKO47443.1 hypothetical protein WG68_01230 [Arsukibacterium ikkense]